jgi:hypothetical protein
MGILRSLPFGITAGGNVRPFSDQQCPGMTNGQMKTGIPQKRVKPRAKSCQVRLQRYLRGLRHKRLRALDESSNLRQNAIVHILLHFVALF